MTPKQAFDWLRARRGIQHGVIGAVADTILTWAGHVHDGYRRLEAQNDHARAALVWALAVQGLAIAERDAANQALVRVLEREAGRDEPTPSPRPRAVAS